MKRRRRLVAELGVAVFVIASTVAALFITREPDRLREAITRIRKLPAVDEASIARELGRYAVHGVRLVRRFEIGDHLESDDGEDFGQFKPAQHRFGGNKDLLTPALVTDLRRGEGIVFLEGTRWAVPDATRPLRAQGWCLLFTIPEGQDRFSYVTVGFGGGVPGWKSSELESR